MCGACVGLSKLQSLDVFSARVSDNGLACLTTLTSLTSMTALHIPRHKPEGIEKRMKSVTIYHLTGAGQWNASTQKCVYLFLVCATLQAWSCVADV